jgi:hypothetical protein
MNTRQTVLKLGSNFFQNMSVGFVFAIISAHNPIILINSVIAAIMCIGVSYSAERILENEL